ncbi:uncharacterized protein STEHIDRAFT_122197 [Stereum hirsutum FP-91666 SS1]|uniref:uncharacterized protein n=1 Tax=Stereum hirsutum (strain FP-91666) TaxID=721885 RepID=UPI00044495D4|nr:uncharacterized protein STEHIDRAFT_122197 [Stereum hirsutum FP-91666 SS1]EIM86263.1 hypothetical protein STEHIDRAFT_122197 [Stereum hirsutum FP-91666 SS1]
MPPTQPGLLINSRHAIDGLYLWEWFTTLNFEVSRRKENFRWSNILYIGCRVAMLGVCMCDWVGFNLEREIDCQTWYQLQLFLSYFALGSALRLLTLYAIATWERNVYVTGSVIWAWLLNTAFCFVGLSEASSQWNAESQSCVFTNTTGQRSVVYVAAIVDLFVMTVALGGELRNSRGKLHSTPVFYIKWMLLISIVLLVELAPPVMISLNLSDELNVVFNQPHIILMVIVATRIHRRASDERARRALTSSDLSTFQVALPSLSSPPDASTPRTIRTTATAGGILTPAQLTTTSSGANTSQSVTILTHATNGSPKPNQESFSSVSAFPDDMGPVYPMRRSSGILHGLGAHSQR